MIKLNCHFSSSLIERENVIYVNGSAYNLQKGLSELNVELKHEINEPIEIEIRSSLKKEENISTNFGKRLIAAIAMMLITSWSTDMYDCDFSNYSLNLLLWPKDTQNMDLYVNKVGQYAESELTCVAQGGVVVEKNKDNVVDRCYAQALFKEYHQLNRWRTGIWATMLLFLIGMGIVTNTSTTIIFPAILLCLIILMFFYTRKRLRKLYAQLVMRISIMD